MALLQNRTWQEISLRGAVVSDVRHRSIDRRVLRPEYELFELDPDNGKITLKNDLDLGVDGDLALAGDAAITGDLDVDGNLDVAGTLDVTGLTTVDDLDVSGDLDVTGDILQGGAALSFGGIEWDSSTTYDANDIVNYGGVLYISLQGSNTNQQPDTATAYWSEYLNSSAIQTVIEDASASAFSTTSTSYVDLVTGGSFTSDGADHLFMLSISYYVDTGSQDIKTRLRFVKSGETTVYLTFPETYKNTTSDHSGYVVWDKYGSALAAGDWTVTLQVAVGAGSNPFKQDVNDYNLVEAFSLTGVQGPKGDAGIAATWDSGTTYSSGDTVSYGTELYQSLQSSNLNKQPDTETSWWRKLTLANITISTSSPSGGVDGDLWFKVV